MVTYLSGNRIQGTSTLPAPSTADVDKETWTAHSNITQGSTAWTNVGSGITVLPATGIQATTMATEGDNRVYRALGTTLSNTQWIAEFEFTMESLSNNNGYFYFFNMSAGTGNFANGTDQDQAYLFLDSQSYGIYARSKDGTTNGSNSTARTISGNTKYYFQVLRNNTTFTVRWASSESNRTNGTWVEEESTSITSNVTGLNTFQSGAVSGGNTATANYKLENLKVWNSTNSTSGTPDVNFSFPTTDGRITVEDIKTVSSTAYHDIGTANITDTWTLKFKVTVSNWTQSGNTHGWWQNLSLSSNNSHSSSSHDGMDFMVHNSSTSEKFLFAPANGGAVGFGSGGILRDSDDEDEYIANGDYYVTIERSSEANYTCTVRTVSHSGTVLGSVSGTNATGVADLRYIKVSTHKSTNASGGSGTVRFSEIDLTTNPTTDEKTSISDVPIGTLYEETDTRKMYRKDTHGWKERDVTTYASMDSFRGCFCGGQASTNTIDYITIETVGNATDFGDLTGNTGAGAGCDNNSRGVIGHGSNNIMDYITIATTGNATDFGDRNNTGDEIGACSDQTTRGIFFGGTAGSRESIDYVTIASSGNATDFGDMTDGRSAPAGLGDTTRGCMGGGSTGSIVNIIDYITIATTGNATDFGDLTQARRHLAGTADETRGVFAGGHASYNNIDYITIQTTGNATDFGDLVNGRYGIAGVSNYARGVFGSSNISGVSNQMDYITIATVGNATDFGDLTVARSNAGGVSGN